MTKEHLKIILTLKIPFVIVITKIDMVSREIIKGVIKQINKIMKIKQINKKPIYIQQDLKIQKIES